MLLGLDWAESVARKYPRYFCSLLLYSCDANCSLIPSNSQQTETRLKKDFNLREVWENAPWLACSSARRPPLASHIKFQIRNMVTG